MAFLRGRGNPQWRIEHTLIDAKHMYRTRIAAQQGEAAVKALLMGSVSAATTSLREFTGWESREPSPDPAVSAFLFEVAAKDGLLPATMATVVAARAVFALAASERWLADLPTRVEQSAAILPPRFEAEFAIMDEPAVASDAFAFQVFTAALGAFAGQYPASPNEHWQRAFEGVIAQLATIGEYETNDLGVTAEPFDLGKMVVVPFLFEYRRMRRRHEITFDYD